VRPTIQGRGGFKWPQYSVQVNVALVGSPPVNAFGMIDLPRLVTKLPELFVQLGWVLPALGQLGRVQL
jgi:hypothetical protein